jgi:3',5'-cyclic AMP phosphodiesterase CpdA
MSAPIRFAQISDTHVRPEAIERSQVFVDHLAEIQAGGYDFVIHTGDLMDEPSAWAARAVKAIISQLRVPVYFVPGNHDVYNPHMGEIEAPWWAKLAVDSSLEAQYTGWFGPAWHTFSCRGVHLVGIDSLIINSGLPEEAKQWAWLEDTLAEIALRQPEQIVLFTHLPLFIRQPDEELDAADFTNRYLVIAPPGRDRLLGLIRQHRVMAVLAGHVHAPWERSHTWPEGFTTQFVCTGSSGVPSPMAIEQFDLPLSPAEGLGYHEHWVTENGLTSRYHRHASGPGEGRWTLGPAWTSYCEDGRAPLRQQGLPWYNAAYDSSTPAWQESAPTARFPLGRRDGEACYVRQAFEAQEETAALYLELLTERAVAVYLNGELVCKLDALDERPQAWWSAGGTYSIDSPVLHLGLNQQLVRKGQNVLALQVHGEAAAGSETDEYIAYRRLERGWGLRLAPKEGEAEQL